MSFFRTRHSFLWPRSRHLQRKIEFMGGSSAVLFGILVVCVFLLSSADRYIITSDQYASVIAAVLVDMANSDRASDNLGGLTINPTLVEAAQAKANDMAAKSYFAHVSPDGVDPWHWFQQAGYTFDYAGENLAVDFSDSGDVNTAWMNSPSHRENILNAHFTEIGIATADGFYEGHPTTFVVQEFGTPSSRATPVVTETLPANPTTLATASATNTPTTSPAVLAAAKPKPKPAPPAASSSAVLGSAVETQPSPPAIVPQVQQPVAPVVVPASEAPQYASAADHLTASPRSLLVYFFYIIGGVILLGLAITIGVEWHYHHLKRIATAGVVMASMFVLILLADYLIFSQPVIALTIGAFHP